VRCGRHSSASRDAAELSELWLSPLRSARKPPPLDALDPEPASAASLPPKGQRTSPSPLWGQPTPDDERPHATPTPSNFCAATDGQGCSSITALVALTAGETATTVTDYYAAAANTAVTPVHGISEDDGRRDVARKITFIHTLWTSTTPHIADNVDWDTTPMPEHTPGDHVLVATTLDRDPAIGTRGRPARRQQPDRAIDTIVRAAPILPTGRKVEPLISDRGP
jgi:hypothetical protein